MISENELVELIRKTATELPEDILSSLIRALGTEEDRSPAAETLRQMIVNAEGAKELSRPMCQDTGTPIFYVTCPADADRKAMKEAITAATRRATDEVPLRPNVFEDGKMAYETSPSCISKMGRVSRSA